MVDHVVATAKTILVETGFMGSNQRLWLPTRMTSERNPFAAVNSEQPTPWAEVDELLSSTCAIIRFLPSKPVVWPMCVGAASSLV